MKLFAKVVNGTVVMVVDIQVSPLDTRAMFSRAGRDVVLLVNIDNVSPQPQVGWTYSRGVFSS